jgi:hypothetical protein
MQKRLFTFEEISKFCDRKVLMDSMTRYRCKHIVTVLHKRFACKKSGCPRWAKAGRQGK